MNDQQLRDEGQRCFDAFLAWWAMGDRGDRDQLSALEGFIAAWPLKNPEDRHGLALAILPLANAAIFS
ncbi:MAG TPA: hypothetical protein VGJ60_06945 [Chloroflexota bacterium]|jgi:hypothetical protein